MTSFRRANVATLLLRDSLNTEKHKGEILNCAWTPDGGSVLTAGWDGQLRLWEATTGNAVAALQAGSKPLSACAVSPDGRHWVSGSMEGLLTWWETHSRALKSQIVRHTRPISSVRFSPDQKLLATTS